MARSFLPNSDAGLLAWGTNFSTLISLTPVTYGLSAGQASAFATLLASYSAALTACNPGVRNKAAVLTKNTARAFLKTNARLLAKIVEGQATVTNAQKATLGLNVRATPSPIPPPAFAPQIDVISVIGRAVKIRLHNTETEPKRGKPVNVKGAAVLSYVGATPPADLSAYKFEGNTTVTVIDLVFPDSVAAGATVWFIAMWFNERAQNGPAATPVNATIQYGLSMAG
jgi:hypothetical protein